MSIEFESAASNLNIRYYGQLLVLSQRITFASTEPWNGIQPKPVSVSFSWDDLMASTSFFSKARISTVLFWFVFLFSSSSPALSDINFERVSVLFCIAALQSQIGALANSSSDEGLKTSLKAFQVWHFAINESMATSLLSVGSSLNISCSSSACSPSLHNTSF